MLACKEPIVLSYSLQLTNSNAYKFGIRQFQCTPTSGAPITMHKVTKGQSATTKTTYIDLDLLIGRGELVSDLGLEGEPSLEAVYGETV